MQIQNENHLDGFDTVCVCKMQLFFFTEKLHLNLATWSAFVMNII